MTKTSLLALDARTKRRNAAESRFRLYGLAAIGVGVAMLALLLVTIFSNGLGAFQQSFITLNVPLLEKKLDKSGERDLAKIKKVSTFGYAPLLTQAMKDALAENEIETDLKSKKLAALLSKSAAAELRNFVIADPSQIGETVGFRFLANSRVDGYLKGRVTRESIADDKSINAAQLDLVDALRAAGVIEKRFNLSFITGADASDQRPEAAGRRQVRDIS